MGDSCLKFLLYVSIILCYNFCACFPFYSLPLKEEYSEKLYMYIVFKNSWLYSPFYFLFKIEEYSKSSVDYIYEYNNKFVSFLLAPLTTFLCLPHGHGLFTEWTPKQVSLFLIPRSSSTYQLTEHFSDNQPHNPLQPQDHFPLSLHASKGVNYKKMLSCLPFPVKFPPLPFWQGWLPFLETSDSRKWANQWHPVIKLRYYMTPLMRSIPNSLPQALSDSRACIMLTSQPEV